MTEAELQIELTDIFRDVFMSDDMELSPDLTAKDVPGWDSSKQIEIIIALEQKFGIKFHTKELDSLHNVGDLLKTVVVKIGPTQA